MQPTLAINYTAPPAAPSADIRLTLEQQPVNRRSGLTQADLNDMLALVLSGQSARRHGPRSCAAWVRQTKVGADLVVHAWPVPADLTYTLEPVGVTTDGPTRVQIEGEFDLIVPMAASVDLPASFEGLAYTWDTPCYNRFGEQVEPPAITVHPARIELDAEVFGVLRITATAIGDRYDLIYQVDKMQGGSVLKYEDLPEAAVITRWTGADGEPANAQLDLAVPGCLADLLAACPDGGLIQDAVQVSAADDVEMVPVVYYSACTGRVIALRYER